MQAQDRKDEEPRAPADGCPWVPWELRRCALLALRRKVAAAPDDARALVALGNLHRGEGNLETARSCYARAAESGSPCAPKAAWSQRLLAGAALPHAPAGGAWPVPFRRFEAVLPPGDHQRLLAAALAASALWQPAGVLDDGVGRLDTEMRLGLVARQWRADEVRDLLTPKVRELSADVRRRLRMAPAQNCPGLPDLVVYRDGGFSRPHYDGAWGDGASYAHQGLMGIYYLHAMPEQFTGGDLLLHDTAVLAGRAVGTRGLFTRLPPTSNSLVFFPQGYYHSIAPVEAAIDDPEASRLSVVYCLPGD